MEKELANVLFWLGNFIDVYDIRVGEYQAMFDEAAQFEEWKCFGCSGTGFSKWPDWKVEFTHMPDCTYQKLMRLIAIAEQEVEPPKQCNCKEWTPRCHTSWPCWCGLDHSTSDLR